MHKTLYLFLAAALLLAGCASTQTASSEITTSVPVAANAQWTFTARTTWGKPVRIALFINKTPLASAAEIAPGSIIGGYQGHAIWARCTTEWAEGAAYGKGTCYVYVDGSQTAILIL